MKTKVLLSIVIGIVLLLSFGIGLKDVKADALLFPWIIKSDEISTIISVVNTAETDFEASSFPISFNEIYLQYFFKQTTANDQTEICEEYDLRSTSSMFDLLTFDVSGHIDGGLPMFNESDQANDPIPVPDYTLPYISPRRAFLIVTNNTDALVDAGTNLEGTLYGEALIVNHQTGASFGYTAYNANPGGVSSEEYMSSQHLYFNNGRDRYGEVIGDGEFGRTVFFPPNEYNTKFYVTPIMPGPGIVGDAPGQQVGNANVVVQFCWRPEVDDSGNPTGDCETNGAGIWNNTEGPLSSNVRKNIVCTTGDNLEDLITIATYEAFVNSGKAGWTYILTHPGNLDVINGTDLYAETNQAVIGKLVYQLDTQEISFNQDCRICQRECVNKEPYCKSPKPSWTPRPPINKKCTDVCYERCKYICELPSQTITTEQIDFQWIRGDDSRPYVHAVWN